jgi:hypothetical protein
VRVEALEFAATLNPTEPLPLPLAPLVTVIQLTLAAADHGQPAPAVTFVDPLPPAAVADRLVDESENVHPAPACVTVKTWPAAVIVPTRCDVLLLAAAENDIVPLPLPDAPAVTLSHDVLLLTLVQVQPAGADTAADPVAPPATTDWLVGEIE